MALSLVIGSSDEQHVVARGHKEFADVEEKNDWGVRYSESVVTVIFR